MRIIMMMLGLGVFVGISAIAGCVGCAAVLIAGATKYDVNASDVTRLYAKDFALVEQWLLQEPAERIHRLEFRNCRCFAGD